MCECESVSVEGKFRNNNSRYGTVRVDIYGREELFKKRGGKYVCVFHAYFSGSLFRCVLWCTVRGSSVTGEEVKAVMLPPGMFPWMAGGQTTYIMYKCNTTMRIHRYPYT